MEKGYDQALRKLDHPVKKNNLPHEEKNDRIETLYLPHLSLLQKSS